MRIPFATRWHKLSGRIRRGHKPPTQFSGTTKHTRKQGVWAK